MNIIKHYRVKFDPHMSPIAEVIEVVTKLGKRISIDESEPDEIVSHILFKGTLSDCESFIRLKKEGYLI